MADDTIWNFVNDYLANNISKAVFGNMQNLNINPSNQFSQYSGIGMFTV